MKSPGRTHLSPMASCISLAATVLSTPPLTAPMTRPVSPQISRIRAISFPINSSYRGGSYEQTSQTCNQKHIYHGPVALAATYIVYKTRDDLLPPWGVRHLGVKLNAVERLRVVRDGGVWRGFRMANDVEIWRGAGKLIAMRHPHLTRKRNPVSQSISQLRGTADGSSSSKENARRKGHCPYLHRVA